mgnify:CR=1 FL=1
MFLDMINYQKHKIQKNRNKIKNCSNMQIIRKNAIFRSLFFVRSYLPLLLFLFHNTSAQKRFWRVRSCQNFMIFYTMKIYNNSIEPTFRTTGRDFLSFTRSMNFLNNITCTLPPGTKERYGEGQ